MMRAETCAHTGRPVVLQRTEYDCMTCALAMLTGQTYEAVVEAAGKQSPSYSAAGPMSHSIMRCLAHEWGFILVSSIYMLWTAPGIIGVLSPTIPDCGHAVLWDGEKIIDPGASGKVDRPYVDRFGLEFTQRVGDLRPLFDHDVQSRSAGAIVADEYF